MVNKVTFQFVYALLRAIMAHATNIIYIVKSSAHTDGTTTIAKGYRNHVLNGDK